MGQQVKLPMFNIHTFTLQIGIDLVYLAMGRVDLYFDVGLHVWDFAGPSLIVTEVKINMEVKLHPYCPLSQAGGVMCDIGGGKLDLMSRKMMAASSLAIVDEVLPLISSIDMGRD